MLIGSGSSPGAAIFKQRRYGLDGQEILVYKFRSMRVCEDGGTINQASRSDPRITRFGAFIRRTSLDELPRLINVQYDIDAMRNGPLGSPHDHRQDACRRLARSECLLRFKLQVASCKLAELEP